MSDERMSFEDLDKKIVESGKRVLGDNPLLEDLTEAKKICLTHNYDEIITESGWTEEDYRAEIMKRVKNGWLFQ